MKEIREIIGDRLYRWGSKLRQENATPILLLGVGRDHKSGQLVVCTLENEEMNRAAILALLRAAVRAIERDAS